MIFDDFPDDLKKNEEDIEEEKDGSEEDDNTDKIEKDQDIEINEDLDLDSLNVTEMAETTGMAVASDDDKDSTNNEIDFDSLQDTGENEDSFLESSDSEIEALRDKYKDEESSIKGGKALYTKQKTKEYAHSDTSTVQEEETEFPPELDVTNLKEQEDTEQTIIENEETFLETVNMQAKLLVKSGKLKKKVFNIESEEVVLGRSIDADITLPDPRSSRTHAQISYDDGEYLIEDLGSANGIKVNGIKVQKQILSSQDKISIGNTVLEFVKVDPECFTPPDDDFSMQLEVQHDIPTEIASDLTAAEIKHAQMQAAKTEMAAGTSVESLIGTQLETEESLANEISEDSMLSETAFQTHIQEPYKNLGYNYEQKPVKASKLLRTFFLGFIFIIIAGILGVMLVMDKGDETTVTVVTPPAQNVRELSPQTGLSKAQEEEALRIYNNAKNFYEDRQYKEAIDEAQKALAIYPGFSQAQEIIQYSKDALDELKLQQKRKFEKMRQDARYSKIEELLNEADRALNAKQYKIAMSPIKDILELEPTNEEALAMLEEAQDGLKRKVRLQKQIRLNRQIMLRNYRKGRNAYQDENYAQALSSFNKVLSMGNKTSPKLHRLAKQGVEASKLRLVEQLAPKVEEAKASMEILDYSKAYKTLNDVLKIYPQHPHARSLRAKALEELTLQVRKIYQQGLVMESINDLPEAIQYYQKILKLAPPNHEYHLKALKKLKKYN